MATDPKDPSADPHPSPRPNELITAQTYELMWQVYRDGQRTYAEVKQKAGVSLNTAKRAVDRGWEDRGWKSLKVRAREHDQLKAEAERQAMIDQHKEATDAWYRAGKQFNRVADNAVTFAIMAMQQIVQLATVRTPNGLQVRPLTKWVRRRSVDVDAEGRRQVRYWDEEVPLSTPEAVKLEAAVLKAAGMAAVFKRMWQVSGEDGQKAQAGPPQGLASLSAEEMEHILSTGQLPPGKTAEDIWGYAVPGFPSKNAKAKNN